MTLIVTLLALHFVACGAVLWFDHRSYNRWVHDQIALEAPELDLGPLRAEGLSPEKILICLRHENRRRLHGGRR